MGVTGGMFNIIQRGQLHATAAEPARDHANP